MATPTLRMPVGKLNLEIRKGSTFNPPMHITDNAGVPVDYSTYTARMQIRSDAASPDILLELTTENGGIVVGVGLVQIVITAEQTAAFTFSGGLYDLELVDTDGIVSCLIAGSVSIIPEITR